MNPNTMRPGASVAAGVLLIVAVVLCALVALTELDTRIPAVIASILGSGLGLLSVRRGRRLALVGFVFVGVSIAGLLAIAFSGEVDRQGRCAPDVMLLILMGLAGWALGLLLSVMSVAGSVLFKPFPEPGRCTRCGYDLTGNISGVCPECGTQVRPAEPGKAVE